MPRVIKRNIKRDNGWFIGFKRLVFFTSIHRPPYWEEIAKPLKPSTRRNAQFIKKPPMAHGNINHQYRGVVKLFIGRSNRRWYIFNNITPNPAANSWDHCFGFNTFYRTIFLIGHIYMLCAVDRTAMTNVDSRAVQSNAYWIIGSI